MTTTNDNPNSVDWAGDRFARNPKSAIKACADLVLLCHGEAVKNGHYHDPDTGEPVDYSVIDLIYLVFRELHEAISANRAGEMDKHLPHRLGVEVEIADALIILFGACGHLGLDLGGAMVEKIEFNRTRADHKARNRRHA